MLSIFDSIIINISMRLFKCKNVHASNYTDLQSKIELVKVTVNEGVGVGLIYDYD